MYYMFEPRSKDWYDDDESEVPTEPLSLSDILGGVVWVIILSILMPIVICGAILWMICREALWPACCRAGTMIKRAGPLSFVIGLVVVWLVELLVLAGCGSPPVTPPVVATATKSAIVSKPRVPTFTSTATSLPSPTFTVTLMPTPTATPIPRSVSVMVDDFDTRPIAGQAVYFYNRLEGDRGAINNAVLTFGSGQITTTVADKSEWGGGWMSLNHPIREGLPINFSAILPAQISPDYQSQITGITARIVRGTPGRTFRLELKDHGALRWSDEIALNGSEEIVSLPLPALANINELVWVLDHAMPGDNVVLDSFELTATTRITDTATAAFVWSYGQLLNNWNPETGLVRDKAKDASGEFDAIQATGSLAAATAIASQLGVISHGDAIRIVNGISEALLDLPRFHGLWPHWTNTSPEGKPTIVWGTEWSSIDTIIAAIGVLTAQQTLGLDTAGMEAVLREIDWEDLVKPDGMISMGYTYDRERIPWFWDTFGGESWLVELAYASATGRVAPLAHPLPPTANGSGFIDELAWLFVPPPAGLDYWGTDWTAYRSTAADRQIRYYPENYPVSCFSHLDLFGLSAAEAPDPSLVPPASIYHAFGVGARDPRANDGSALLGAPVVVPHYAGLIASLRPDDAIEMWDWLIQHGHFSPLNSVESLMFPPGAACDSGGIVWNQLKGSWNLAIQTLAWGRYLAERRGQAPILWQAAMENPFLQQGYRLLALDGAASAPIMDHISTPVTPFAVSSPPSAEMPVTPDLDATPVAYGGQTLHMWRTPGCYEYSRTGDRGGVM